MNMMNTCVNKGRFRHACCISMLIAVMLSGCGEFAYKRGANLSDLENAKKICKEKGLDAAAAEKCMANNGWVVQNLSKMEPIDADPVVEASVIPSDQRIENAASSKQHAEEYVSYSPPHPATAVRKEPAAMDLFKVSSWWKAGGGADSLKIDTEACVARLGEAHRPDSQIHAVTRGLLLCMKEKGWSGLRAK